MKFKLLLISLFLLTVHLYSLSPSHKYYSDGTDISIEKWVTENNLDTNKVWVKRINVITNDESIYASGNRLADFFTNWNFWFDSSEYIETVRPGFLFNLENMHFIINNEDLREWVWFTKKSIYIARYIEDYNNYDNFFFLDRWYHTNGDYHIPSKLMYYENVNGIKILKDYIKEPETERELYKSYSSILYKYDKCPFVSVTADKLE